MGTQGSTRSTAMESDPTTAFDDVSPSTRKVVVPRGIDRVNDHLEIPVMVGVMGEPFSRNFSTSRGASPSMVTEASEVEKSLPLLVKMTTWVEGSWEST